MAGRLEEPFAGPEIGALGRASSGTQAPSFDNDADNLVDEFAEEAGIDARKAIGDLVRQLADQTAPLSNYRR